jgi:aminopeptidase
VTTPDARPPLDADERLRRYAELAVRVGANVQQGQEVVVQALIEHAAVARAVVREAYRAGASRVTVRYSDQHVRRAAVELGPEEMLGQTPQFLLDATAAWRDERPAVISLAGDPEPELLGDLDPALVAKSEAHDLRAVYQPLVTERLINWVIVAAPNEGWARTIFGEPDMERLWDAVATGTRLDREDPVAAWREHDAMLKARAAVLNGHGFDAIRFRGPGTDLTVGLMAGSRWICAAFRTVSGIEHIPNLPTEEVFTTPDLRRTEGTVRSTYPLAVGGSTVLDLELRFEAGRVVEARASQGVEIIRGQLAADRQAPFLGEIALVDGSSAVKQTGLVFQNTLFDENATCHIAYGTGLPMAVDGTDGLTKDELLALGVNIARVHTDFMIGGPEVDVDGLDRDGNATPVMRDDAFVL